MNKKLLLTLLPLLVLSGCNKKQEENIPEDNDKYDYVLLAQPVVTAVTKAKENLKVFANVQEEYQTKTEGKEITQASIFVKGDADETKVNNFLATIKKEVNAIFAASDNQYIANATKDIEDEVFSAKLGGTKQMISTLARNGSLGIGYKEAKKNKESIDNFIGTLGMPASKDEAYYTVGEGTVQSALDLNVAVPSGAPAVAFYNHLSDSKLEVNSNANNVIAYLSDATSNKDVVVVPTNAGLAAINKGANYKIAATITFGNFFLLSTGNDNNDKLDKGDKVLAFQENGVAGKLFQYVYGDKELDVTYLADAVSVKNYILTEE